MYRVILVDNEQTIRNGIRNSVNWNRLGLEVVGEAADGQSALRKIDELSPDILITDIKMPQMDGLQLSELALAMSPELKIIIISGFDDFKYAQKGIRIGVSGYLLKPVREKELEELLVKITAELAEKREMRSAQETLSKFNVDYLVLGKFFRDIIFGKANDAAEIEKQLMSGNINSFAVMVLEVDNYLNVIRDMSEEEQRSFSRVFFETADAYFSQNGGVVNVAADNCTCIVALYDTEESRVSNNILKISIQLRQIMRNRNISISIGIGRNYSSAQGWRMSYQEARKALKQKFLMGEGSTIYYSGVEKMEANYDFSQMKTVGEVVDAVRRTDADALGQVLERATIEMMTGGQMMSAYVNLFVSSVFRKVLVFLESIDISAEEIFENPMEVYADLLNRQTIRDTTDRLREQLLKVIRYIGLKKQGKFSEYIDRAKRYIEEHYTESDINIEKIAGQIQMSVSYFSMEFKKYVGITYIEFLTDLRIRRAKELLRGTALKISEISEMVGYENPSYFNFIFRKNVGKTPGEYRKES